MGKQPYSRKKRGSILLFALWSLLLLTTFAVTLGVIVRQKITLVVRLEERNRLHLIAQSGVKKAVVVLNTIFQVNDTPDFVTTKQKRHNNEDQFGNILLGEGSIEIAYEDSHKGASPEKHYGIIDEGSKINANTADIATVKSLIKNVLHWKEEAVDSLALAIADWRGFHESEMTGFNSDKYYENLEDPYAAKDSAFEVIDELLLVKGMNGEILDQLRPYLTIYGDGRVNINTAPAAVLVSLGLSDDLVKKILAVRQGPDGIEATGDDHVFQNIYNLQSELETSLTLTNENVSEINALVKSQKLIAFSRYYLVQSRARLNKPGPQNTVRCVYDTQNHRIEYWREFYEVVKEVVN